MSLITPVETIRPRIKQVKAKVELLNSLIIYSITQRVMHKLALGLEPKPRVMHKLALGLEPKPRP